MKERLLTIAITLLAELNPALSNEEVERMAKFGISMSQSPNEYITMLYDQAGICR